MEASAMATLIDRAMDYSYDGEQQHFRNPLYPKDVVYTRGVRYIAEHAGGGAWWLLDKIATMQSHPQIRTEQVTQLWSLWVGEERNWALICQDGDYHLMWAEGGSHTDFPVGHITFFVQHQCIMLTSEY
jgi:hypothetical protein